jgi:hypothetical protein
MLSSPKKEVVMRRLGILLSVSIVALLGIVAARPSSDTRAQDGTPPAGHPLIGAWLADTDADNPDNPPSLFIFHDDGTYVQADPDGTTGVGAWEATGPTTARLTAVFLGQDEAGAFGGSATVRASIEVDAAANTLTAQFTLDFAGPDGMSTGEMGPGTATAERIVVEEMGTPVAPMELGPAGTPAAG